MLPAAELPTDGASPDHERSQKSLEQLGHVIVGQHAMLEQLLIALLAGGHALLEGVPGTGKTLAILALSRVLGVTFGRIQFTPDLMPADVTGLSTFDPRERDFVFRPGPVFADLLLADEVNRAPAKTQAALLEAMQERRVTVDGVSRPLPEHFTVFASQNPVESEGTYPLPEAQLDRFLMKIAVGYPDAQDELELLARYTAGFDAGEPGTFALSQVLAAGELGALRAAVRRVRMAEDVRAYVVAVVRATREDSALALGASPRAAVALFRASQARAFTQGRDYVLPEDVKELARPVLRHRVLVAPDAEIDGITSDERIDAVLRTVEAPH